MITIDGYSKDPSIIPEGIAVTWGKDLINYRGGLLSFIRFFEQQMGDESSLWLQKCRSAPKIADISYVYIIVCNRVQYRLYYGGFESGVTSINTGNGSSWSKSETVSWPRIIAAGPFLKAPRKIMFKGFQGFRYTTKLF